MPETVFSRIIRGELPVCKVYEDEHVLAFLDIGPVSAGHTLVIPKEPAVTLADLSDEAAGAVGRALPRLCRAVMEATGATEYNILQNNGAGARQVVQHVHFHIIPKYPDGKGLVFSWGASKLVEAEGRVLAAKIAAALAER